MLVQDCPQGQYALLEKSGKKQKSKIWRELWNGVTNYRMYGLAACYAYTFGVEVRAHRPPLMSAHKFPICYCKRAPKKCCDGA